MWTMAKISGDTHMRIEWGCKLWCKWDRFVWTWEFALNSGYFKRQKDDWLVSDTPRWASEGDVCLLELNILAFREFMFGDGQDQWTSEKNDEVSR
jgi:hypothetical protein